MKKVNRKPRHTISLNWWEARESKELARGKNIQLFKKYGLALMAIESKMRRGK